MAEWVFSIDLNTYSLGVIYLCYLFLKLHNIDAAWLYSYINAEKATSHWGKDTVTFFLREWVENWLFTVNRSAAWSSSAREGGRNWKISGGGVWAEDWEVWGKTAFVSREALSGTVSSGHAWPTKCVTQCLPTSKTADENGNIRVLICYLCVVTPASDSINTDQI